MARPERHILPALLAGATLVTGCARDDETSMRAQLAQWFALGDTLAFAAEPGCAAGAFRLVHDEIGAGVPVTRNVPDMLRALPARGVAAVDDPALSPDDAIVQVTNHQRHTGMSMRSAAFESKACLSGPLAAEFRRLLVYPQAILAFEATEGTVMLLDRRNRVLVVVKGDVG